MMAIKCLYLVFQIPDHEKARQTVEMALANGYRMIDTAEVYEN